MAVCVCEHRLVLMSFISYNLEYFKDQLQKLESTDVTSQNVYHAKQLLKIVDDLVDEGYCQLSDAIEQSFSGVSRIRNYLQKCGAQPFSVKRSLLTVGNITYDNQKVPLCWAINQLVNMAQTATGECNNVFIAELVDFCKWIGYNDDIAYVFLLRDTLLPYIYFSKFGKTNIYPWLLGRQTLAQISQKQFVDDEIRASIFCALEMGKANNFEEFCDAVLPKIRATVGKYVQLEHCLMDLLSSIKQSKIVVVESGCSGTIPMLLKSLDDRVDIKMYTTYPYLQSAYKDKIFTTKYENIRLFETLLSQDAMLKFNCFVDGKFYVNMCNNQQVITQSCEEIKAILR